MKQEPHPLDAWIRQGQPEPMDESLKDHLRICPTCACELEALRALQARLELPGPVISEKKAGEIRFLLEAECNRRKGAGAREVRQAPRYRWILGLVGATALSLGLFFSVRFFMDKAPARDAAPVSRARILPEAGARWSRVVEGQTELVMLEEGTVEFHVHHLKPGQAFLVKTGTDWVEVRGTRFTVSAAAGLLQKVRVTEGVVSVHVTSENVLLLAGQQWTRPELAAAPELPQEPAKPAPEPVPGPTAAADAGPMSPTDDAVTPPMRAAPVPEPVRVPEAPMTPQPQTSPQIIAPVDMAPPPHATPEPLRESEANLRFSEAYRVLQSGNWRRAVTLFSELLQERGLGQKRADVLFWLAQAHLKGGQYEQAILRLNELTQSYPASWRARDAKDQLRLLKSRPR